MNNLSLGGPWYLSSHFGFFIWSNVVNCLIEKGKLCMCVYVCTNMGKFMASYN